MKFQQWLVAASVALLIVGCGSPSANPSTNQPTSASGSEATGVSGGQPAATSASQSTSAPAPGGSTNGKPTVARVGQAVLSREDMDKRIALIQETTKKLSEKSPQNAPPPQTNDTIERDLVELFIQENLLLNIARDHQIAMADKDVDAQIAQIRTNIASGGGDLKLDDVIQVRLGFSGETSPEFRQFVSSLVAQQKLAETLVTTDTVKQKVTEQVMADAKKEVETADVAHILVETEDDAKKVLARLDKGEKFADLAKELSKDPGSADKGGEYKGIKRGEFVPEFDKAMFDELKPGETTKTPVKTQFGYHIIHLIDKHKGPMYTDEQAKQMIDQQVSQQLQQKRQEALQKLLEDERKKAKDSGQLEEPVYPTPTPAPEPTPMPTLPADSTPAATAPAPTAAP